MGKKARFLVLEGLDYTGKTTQLDRIETYLRLNGEEPLRYREPGGTKIGERIRDLLLDKAHPEMTAKCELMLFCAGRVQLLEQEVLPALAEGRLVIYDRYYFSSAAYQGSQVYGQNWVVALSEDWLRLRQPDLVVYLDGDPETLARRARGEKDRIEERGVEFQKRVRQAYLAMADHRPELFVTVNAERSIEEVWTDVKKVLEDRVLEGVVRG